VVSSFEKRRLEFADRLSQLRERSEMSAKELAAVVGWNASKVSKIETGKQTPSNDDLVTWLGALGTDDELVEKMRDDLRDLRISQAAWKRQLRVGQQVRQEQDSADELSASLIRAVDVMAVPGILQTPEYARAVLLTQADLLGLSKSDIDGAVRVRMRRQQILYEPGRRIEILMAEAALGMSVCPPTDMLIQIDRLTSVVGLPGVRFGILPLRAQSPNLLPHGYWIVDHEVAVELVHAETRVTDPDEVAIYTELTDRLWTIAAEGDRARRLLARVSAEIRDGLD
jgi:transcriptional regulator with XRE-family HTH domain